jgi:hypothetical protein
MWSCAVWQLVVNICSYSLLLKRMKLTCAVWVESLKTLDGGGKHIVLVKNMSLCHCMTFLPQVTIF